MSLLSVLVIEHWLCFVIRFLITESHIVLAYHKTLQLAICDTVGDTFRCLLGFNLFEACRLHKHMFHIFLFQ